MWTLTCPCAGPEVLVEDGTVAETRVPEISQAHLGSPLCPPTHPSHQCPANSSPSCLLLLNPGYLRDVTGNYTASFVVAGAFLLAGSSVLLTLPRFFPCSPAATSGSPQTPVTEALDSKGPLPEEEGPGDA